MEKFIEEVINGISNSYGTAFFENITLELDRIIKADYTFIALLDEKAYTSTTIALVVKGALAENISYSLEHTPCANVADDTICCYEKEVCLAYPDDQLLKDMKVEAYLGTPLHDSKGNVMGIIVAMYEQPIKDHKLITSLFQLFSGRIAAELERFEFENSLIELNEKLEENVQQRTAELSLAIERLKETQDLLVESKKMASLGNLVSGVAHEVNTPIGIAITGQSVLHMQLEELQSKLANQQYEQISSQLVIHMLESSQMVTRNLERAANVVANFKQIAVDQHVLPTENIDLIDYLNMVITTMQPLLKEKNVKVTLGGEISLICNTYPSVHAQWLTQLISNSIKHGFKTSENNQIKINVLKNKSMIELRYSDNGVGLHSNSQNKIFEPFFTQNRGESSGLGLAIVFNLVTHKLKGDIRLLDSDNGCHYQINFPAY